MFNLSSKELPSWVLLEGSINHHILILEGKPIMLSTEFALDNNFMFPVLDFILLWISSDVKSGMILIGFLINLCIWLCYTVKRES